MEKSVGKIDFSAKAIERFVEEFLQDMPTSLDFFIPNDEKSFPSDLFDFFVIKSYAEFLSRLKNLIKALYSGTIGGDFVDSLAALVSRQITLAYRQAWDDEGEGTEGEPLPEYLIQASETMILEQYDFVDGLYHDIVDARTDKKPIDPFFIRAELWANQFETAYSTAITKIVAENGGTMEWVYGDADHCDTCELLNGKVAYAKDWERYGVLPRHAPNDKLDCGGWRCQCSLIPTNKARTENFRATLRSLTRHK